MESLVRPRCHQDCDRTRNTQRCARTIARERKVTFHHRLWKTILIVVMLRVRRLESVLGNLRNGIISLSVIQWNTIQMEFHFVGQYFARRFFTFRRVHFNVLLFTRYILHGIFLHVKIYKYFTINNHVTRAYRYYNIFDIL